MNTTKTSEELITCVFWIDKLATELCEMNGWVEFQVGYKFWVVDAESDQLASHSCFVEHIPAPLFISPYSLSVPLCSMYEGSMYLQASMVIERMPDIITYVVPR